MKIYVIEVCLILIYFQIIPTNIKVFRIKVFIFLIY